MACGAEPAAHDYDREIRRLEEKKRAGAEFLMTQPAYDPAVLRRFIDDTRSLRLPVLVGLCPLASSRNAEFLHNEVPGMQIPDTIREAGGAVFAVTSEPQTLATEAGKCWELDFKTIGDPHHEIAGECRANGWLSLFVNTERKAIAGTHGYGAHPRGFFQPGILALTREGRVLYRWRGRPTRKNMGGATERPVPSEVWKKVSAALEAGESAIDAEMDVPGRIDMPGAPWPLFVTLLMANGNFLRPKTFSLERNGPDDVSQRARNAILKVPLFLGAWILALVFLPTWLVLSALALWAAVVAPPLIELHREFQNVPEREPDPS